MFLFLFLIEGKINKVILDSMNMGKDYGQMVLRIAIGSMFLVSGIRKLINPEGIVGLLTSLNFVFPVFLGWITLISELTFGLLLIVGWKVRYSVIPLIIVILVALFFVAIPKLDINLISFLVVSLAGLFDIAFSDARKKIKTQTKKYRYE